MNHEFGEDVHKLTKVRYNFRVKRPLPTYDLPEPPHPAGGKNCIIYCLFRAYPPIVPYYVINSAFWAAHSWRVNSNAIDEGWDIWFLVEAEMWDNDQQCQEMFAKANLSDRVLRFPMPKGRAETHLLGHKFCAVISRQFDEYERCLLADTDMFLSRTPNSPRIDMSLFAKMGNDESEFLTDSYRKRREPKEWHTARDKYLDMTEQEAHQTFQTYIKRYMGYETGAYYGVTGQLFTWNPQALKAEFKQNIHVLTPDISDDEGQYGLYLQKYALAPAKLSHLRGSVPLCFQREDLVEQTQYLDHVWLDRNPDRTSNERKAWYRDVERRQVQPLSAYDAPDIADIWRENIGLERRIA